MACIESAGSVIVAATASEREGDAASTTPTRTVRIGVAGNGQWLSRTELHVADLPGVDAETRQTITNSDDWQIHLTPQSFGATSGLRLSVSGGIGDDYYTLTEIAVLLRIASNGTPTVVWAGAGYRLERRMDMCFVERFATFRIVPPHMLERRFTREARIQQQDVPADLAGRIRRECVAGSGRVVRWRVRD